MVDHLLRMREILATDLAHKETMRRAAKDKNAPPSWDAHLCHRHKQFREQVSDEVIFLMLAHLMERADARADSPH